MFPYFKFTEEVQGFCELMGYSVEHDATHANYVCMYTLNYTKCPHIAIYNLNPELHPYIPEAKVIEYLALILEGYSHRDAINELGVVGNRCPSSP